MIGLVQNRFRIVLIGIALFIEIRIGEQMFRLRLGLGKADYILDGIN